MVKVSEIIAQVEYLKEGWSDARTPSDWKETYKKRNEVKAETQSPTRKELNKLQESGTMSRNFQEPEQVKIVGK